MARVYVIGHKSPDTDSVTAAIAYAEFKGKVDLDDEYIPARAGELNPETKYVLEKLKSPVPELLADASGKKIILVDHNEMGQVVNGVDKAQIFEILDHHKIGGIQSSAPILFHAEPVGSTDTIVADFFFYHKIPVSKKLASLMLAGILSDTVVLRSPTTTDKDKLMVKKLAKIAQIKPVPFGIEIKEKKATLKGRTAQELILTDFKEFEKNGYKYGISQIEVVHYDEAIARKDELLRELAALGASKGERLTILMVTNIIEEATKLWFVGDEELIKKAFKKPIKDHEVYLPKVMSRKAQVVPPIQEAI